MRTTLASDPERSERKRQNQVEYEKQQALQRELQISNRSAILIESGE